MFEFLNEVAVWIYLLAAVVSAGMVAFVAYNPQRAMRLVLRKDKKTK